MVKKSDRSWRPCGDYRHLNIISETDYYPLPNMANITSSLAGARVFSKLDLKKGEATSKGYFTPAGRDPDHVQRIRNGDSSTKAKILYADGRVFVIACALFIK